MRYISSRTLCFGFVFTILLLSNSGFFNLNPSAINSTLLNQGNEINIKENANSIVFNGLYYSWSGSITIIGLGGFGWSGTESYAYQSGRTFTITSTNSYFGDGIRTVDNASRQLTQISGSTIWAGHDPFWIFNNVTIGSTVPIAIPISSEQTFTVAGESNRSALGKTYLCWYLTGSYGSVAYYEKVTGLLIYGDFRFPVSPYTYSISIGVTSTNALNFFPCTLNNGQVTPSSGNTSTYFTFATNYTDPDNIQPAWVRLSLDNSVYEMTKQNSGDTNYADGCIYQYITPLSNTTHQFHFETSDYKYYARDPISNNYTGPYPVNEFNVASPTLSNGLVSPDRGHNGTTFTFEVTYSDADNNPPSNINLILNQSVYSMTKKNPTDINYMDGCVFVYSTALNPSVYNFYFNASDSKFTSNSSLYFGPTVWIPHPATPVIFNGMYYFWSGTRNSLSWNGNENYSNPIGNVFQNNGWYYYYGRSNDAKSVNNLTRFYPSSTYWGSNSRDWVWIWNNLSLYDTTSIAVYRDGDHIFNITGTGIVNRLGKNWNCWKLTDTRGSVAYYDKNSGLLISGSFYSIYYGYTYTIAVTATNAPDFSPPILSESKVVPTAGNLTNLYNFTLLYTDEHMPLYGPYLTLNGTAYKMSKVNSGDTNYTDGALYQYATYLPNGTYAFHFNATEGRYWTRYPTNGEIVGPTVEYTNIYDPTLTNRYISANYSSTLSPYIFRVTYTDLDNNAPLYVYLVLNGIPYPMAKQTISDNYYVDGCVYQTTLNLNDGNYFYYFNTSDIEHSARLPLIGEFSGPFVFYRISDDISKVNRLNSTNSIDQYYFLYSQTSWAAVAVKPPVGADFDLNLYSTYNLTQLSASSSTSGANIDLVALNRYDITSPKYRFTRVLKTFGEGDYRIEMQNTSETLNVLNSYLRTMTSSDLITSYQIAGHQINRLYQINVTPDSGMDVGIYVFNTTGGLPLALNSSSTGGLGASESVLIKLSSTNTFGLVITNENGAYGNYSISITDNVYPPILSDTTLNPGSGTMTSPYTFTVKYTDRDNYAPAYMKIVLNGTAFPMNKQNPTDTNYIDGCIYNFTTILSDNITYYYETSDGRFRIRYPSSSNLTGPLVQYGNLAPPALNNGAVIPTKGWDLTVFTFQVNYSDNDNNPPSLITVTINGTSYPMIKQNQLDINWINGVIYEYKIILREYGTYYYHFNASDGVYSTSYPPAGEIQGPNVTNELHDYMMYFPVQFQWEDIRTDRNLRLSQGSAVLYWDLPFSFPFYNETYTEVNIGANGYLSFVSYTFSTLWGIPNSNYQRYILPYLESFYPAATGMTQNVYVATRTNPNRFIVEWENMRINAIGGVISATFEVILYETGAIKFQYDFVSALDSYQVVGLNHGDGIHFNKFTGLNTSINDFAIMFYYDATQLVYENILPAGLSNPELTPPQGNTTTPFTFRINYTDPENYKPAYMNVVINGISYPMVKQNPADGYYADGCIYEYTTVIPSNFTYYYICNDQGFDTRYPIAANLTGPPLELVNNNSPILYDVKVLPYHGFEPTLFEYYVNYTDLDNNPPTYLTLTINGTAHQMVPLNPADLNFIDGTIYFFNETMDLGQGSYVYYISTSDGVNTVVSPLYSGPEVQPYDETILVNEVTLGYERIELLNLGPDQDMTGWSLRLYRLNLPYWTVNFPNGLIFHRNIFILFQNGGNVDNITLGYGTNLVWYNGESGAVAIVNNLGEVVDFMCWNSFSGDTLPGTLWFGSAISIPVLSNMYRNKLTDTHTQSDWTNVAIDTYTWLNWNPGQSAPINYAPVLSSPAVNPLNGRSYTEFTFEVTYTDSNNDPPSSILVFINGTSHPLTKRYTDFDYTDGCIYEFKTTLDPGTYNYYFTASDGALNARSPLTGNITGPTVIPNYSPVLSNPLLSPGTGIPSTLFTFSINYLDSNNDPPAVMSITINGVGTFTMSKQVSGDLDFTDGCIYVYTTLLDEGNYTHYFTASDGYASVRLPVSDSFVGPLVNPPPNQPPQLTGGSVLPPAGTPSTIFIFKVIYQDDENTPPINIYVVIDSVPHSMAKANPSDTYFIDGVDYIFALSLSSGSHPFYFTTSDGLNNTRFPSMGTIDGPTIQSGGGGGGGGFSFQDVLWALILAGALAVAIPITTYILGRRKRQIPSRAPQRQILKALKEETIAPKDQRAHTTAEATIYVPPIPKSLPPSEPTPLQSPVIPVTPVRKPLTEEELKAILQSISFLSEEQRKDLLERLKSLTYEMQQDIIKAFKV